MGISNYRRGRWLEPWDVSPGSELAGAVSCSTPSEEGMVIKESSPKAEDSRSVSYSIVDGGGSVATIILHPRESRLLLLMAGDVTSLIR